MRVLILIVLLFVSCGSDNEFSSSESTSDNIQPISNIAQSSGANLRLASYNFHGIPKLAKKNDFTRYNKTRTRAFIQRLHTQAQNGELPDVLIMQEVFDPEMFRTFIGQSPYQYGFSDNTGSFNVNIDLFNIDNSKLTGSGLLILSRFPISRQGLFYFPDDLCAIDDCFSRKGVGLTDIFIPGLNINFEIYNTHMQSGQNHNQVRRDQLDFIYDVFRQTSRRRMGVLVGDFNFRERIAQERQLIDDTERLFDSENLTRQCRFNDSCDYFNDGRRPYDNVFDHFFLFGSEARGVNVSRVRSEFLRYNREGQSFNLSDHPYLEVEMTITL